jgi:uncharacterized membrane-anchored protein YhcB (DUF1043 family)
MCGPGLIIFIPLLALLIGILIGSGITTKTQDKRDRKQADTQRDLNLQFRVLREQQEAAEEELRWLAKQQAGLKVVDYEITNETPRRIQRRASHQ